jgi:hypothetical protein
MTQNVNPVKEHRQPYIFMPYNLYFIRLLSGLVYI